jgi:hypothetical protein
MSIQEAINILKNIAATLAKQDIAIKELQLESKINNELLSNNYERLEDISKKFDILANMGGINRKPTPVKKADVTKPKKPVKKETDELKSSGTIFKNIMTYFKLRYIENQNYFDEVFEEKQVESLFIEHEKDLSSKKGSAKLKAQANLLYKNLTEDQRKKVRYQMNDENDATSVPEGDDIEEEHSE